MWKPKVHLPSSSTVTSSGVNTMQQMKHTFTEANTVQFQIEYQGHMQMDKNIEKIHTNTGRENSNVLQQRTKRTHIKNVKKNAVKENKLDSDTPCAMAEKKTDENAHKNRSQSITFPLKEKNAIKKRKQNTKNAQSKAYDNAHDNVKSTTTEKAKRNSSGQEKNDWSNAHESELSISKFEMSQKQKEKVENQCSLPVSKKVGGNRAAQETYANMAVSSADTATSSMSGMINTIPSAAINTKSSKHRLRKKNANAAIIQDSHNEAASEASDIVGCQTVLTSAPLQLEKVANNCANSDTQRTYASDTILTADNIHSHLNLQKKKISVKKERKRLGHDAADLPKSNAVGHTELLVPSTDTKHISADSTTSNNSSSEVTQNDCANQDSDVTLLLKFEQETKTLEGARQWFSEQARLAHERMLLRKANANVLHRSAAMEDSETEALTSLDSSIKKCTGFRNKIQSLSLHSTEMLIKEQSQLNLSKYVDELVQDMLMLKPVKQADFLKFAAITSALHQRYNTFLNPLLTNLSKQIRDTSMLEKGGSMGMENASRKRASLRLYCELLFCGLTNDASPVFSLLGSLMAKDMEQANDPYMIDTNHVALSIVISFVRYGGEELLGVQSKKTRIMLNLLKESSPRIDCLDMLVQQHQRESWLRGFIKYFDAMSSRAMTLHDALERTEQRAAKAKLMRGAVPEYLANDLSTLRGSWNKFWPGFQSFCDLMGREEPNLSLSVYQTEAVLSHTTHDTSEASSVILFDDEEIRSFYEELPDLLLVVPPILLSDGNEKEKAKLRRQHAKDQQENADDEDTGEATEMKSPSTHLTDAEDLSTLSIHELEHRFAHLPDAEDMELPAVMKSSSSAFELLLADLSSCYNSECVDAIAERFCYINLKSNRLRLAQHLFHTHWSKSSQLPYFCRLVATLSVHMQDVGQTLTGLLQREFYRLLYKKTDLRVEVRLCNIRFIGELTKFRVAPPIVALGCLRATLLKFNNIAIPVACCLLETCGNWLYRNPLTHSHLKELLAMMTRITASKYLDKEQQMLVDNALSSVVPSTSSAISHSKERSMLNEFIRITVYKDLTPTSTEAVLRRLRRLNWDDSETSLIAIKTLANANNVKWSNLASLASVIAGLDYFYGIGVRIVDGLLEEVRYGLETNYFTQLQRRIVQMKFLGELYAYNQVNEQIIFDTLYLLITFGHKLIDGKLVSDIDPPTDSFRIRLVCTLLDNVGRYFGHGQNARRLDRFLLHFQRYILLKSSIPIEVEFTVTETFEKLRPNMLRIRSVATIVDKLRHLPVDRGLRKDRLIPLIQSDLHPVTSDLHHSHAAPEDDVKSNSDFDSDSGSASTSDDEQIVDCESPLLRASTEQAHENQSNRISIDDASTWQRRRVVDDELAQLFDRIMLDSLESRKLIVPTTISSGLPAVDTANNGTRVRFFSHNGEDHVILKLLSRGSTKNFSSAAKVTGQELAVPLNSTLATLAIGNEEAAKSEKEDIKRLVIAGMQREEREEREAAYDTRSPVSGTHQVFVRKGNKLNLASLGHAFSEFRKPKGQTIFASKTMLQQ